MTVTEAIVDACVVGFPSNIGSSGALVTWGTYTVPAGSTLLAAGFAINSATGVSAFVWSTSSGQTLTNLTPTWNGNTNPLIISYWHNSGGSSVSVTVQIRLTYSNNKTVGAIVQVVSGDDGSPTIVTSQSGSTQAPELSATPSAVGSLMCLYFGQPGATANTTSFVTGSAADTSPASLNNNGSAGANSIAGGIIHQTATNSQTSSSVTVGASAPSDPLYAALVEFKPPSSGTPATGTAALSLTASGTATAPATGTAALSLTATGAVKAPVTGTAAFSVTAAGAARAPVTGTAAFAFAASGTAAAPVTGTAALDLSAQGAALIPTTGTAVLALLGAGVATAPAGGTAVLDLAATGTASSLAIAAGTAAIALTASGAASAAVASTAAIAFTATGAALGPATGTAVLSFTASGNALAAALGTAALSLLAAGAASGQGAASGSALLDLVAAGTTGATALGSAAIAFAASGTPAGQAVGTAVLALLAAGAATGQSPAAGTAVLTLLAAGVAHGGASLPTVIAAINGVARVPHAPGGPAFVAIAATGPGLSRAVSGAAKRPTPTITGGV